MRMGPYELLEVVGRGGMGTVYRSLHPTTGETVAVKVMVSGMASDPVLYRRFEKECAAASRLRHPHIVRGLDFGVEGGQPYLVMEFVDGPTLGQHVRQHGPLPEGVGVRLALQLADALHVAHQNQLIHRDVKPENVLLGRDGGARLADLGLVKDLNASAVLTLPRAGLGTVAFTAPEQFGDAQNADARSDVYGLAATLYYALTGAAPFPGCGNLAVMRKKLTNDFLPPSHLAPALSGRTDEAIRRALDVSPERRPVSCAEFAALLTGSATADTPGGASDPAPGSSQEVPPESGVEERRHALRYPSLRGASCRPAEGTEPLCLAEVQDLSLTGVCLRLPHRFEAGAALGVEVLDEQSGTVTRLQARVCWVRKGLAGQWSVGCAFERELTEPELITLLENKPPTVLIQAPE